MQGMPLALTRFMIPWIELSRKLSDPAFITSRCTPTQAGRRAMIRSAITSLRVRFDSTTAAIRFCGTVS